MIAEALRNLKTELGEDVKLVAVSKYSSDEEVLKAYEAGQRDFGENKAQDLRDRMDRMPEDINWHFIGHLQRNKVKYLIGKVKLIHSVDSLKLLKELDKRSEAEGVKTACLLQVHIADEETKFGFDSDEVIELFDSGRLADLSHVKFSGLMGMATNSDDTKKVRGEFKKLKELFDEIRQRKYAGLEDFTILSMGMTQDYKIALEEGSNMVRIGSAIFK